MRIGILLCLLVFSPLSFSQESIGSLPQYDDPSRIRFQLGFGYESRMIKQISSDVEYDSKSYPSLFFALRKNWFQTLTEFNGSSDSSQAGSLNVEYERYELRQWFRALLYPQKSWSPHIGLSLGAHQEEVKTRFFSEQRVDKSDLKLNTGAEFGIQGYFYRRLFSEINFRALQDVANTDDLTELDRWGWSLQLRIGISTL